MIASTCCLLPNIYLHVTKIRPFDWYLMSLSYSSLMALIARYHLLLLSWEYGSADDGGPDIKVGKPNVETRPQLR